MRELDLANAECNFGFLSINQDIADDSITQFEFLPRLEHKQYSYELDCQISSSLSSDYPFVLNYTCANGGKFFSESSAKFFIDANAQRLAYDDLVQILKYSNGTNKLEINISNNILDDSKFCSLAFIYDKFDIREKISSSDKQILYMHMPKTAGTSIEKYFSNSFDVLNVVPMSFHKYDLTKYTVIVSHVNRALFDKAFTNGVWSKFTFFRDPRDRILSDYYYLESYHKQNMDLLEFLKRGDGDFLKDYGHIIDNAYVRYLINRDHDYNPLSEDDVKMALEYLETFDFIGFTETINEDLEVLTQAYCMDRVEIMHRHKRVYSQHSTPIDQITPEIENELSRLTKYDYIIYDKAKEISKRKRQSLLNNGLDGKFWICKD